jgi:AhpD family alkylhydroperoxidase
MRYGTTVQEDLHGPTRDVRRPRPTVDQGFSRLQDAAPSAGALDAKTKELLALAIAVSKECDSCIAAHARGAVGEGATPEEAAETIGVAILMNGGPDTAYGPRAFAAFEELYAEHHREDQPAARRPRSGR